MAISRRALLTRIFSTLALALPGPPRFHAQITAFLYVLWIPHQHMCIHFNFVQANSVDNPNTRSFTILGNPQLKCVLPIFLSSVYSAR